MIGHREEAELLYLGVGHSFSLAGEQERNAVVEYTAQIAYHYTGRQIVAEKFKHIVLGAHIVLLGICPL